MGFLSRRPREQPTEVEGDITRIGIIRHFEDGVSYGVHLKGVDGMFEVSDRIGKSPHDHVFRTNPHITMAARGDRVRFGTLPKEPHIVIGFFVNETMKVDLG